MTTWLAECVGAIIIALVLLQGLAGLFSSARRLAHEHDRRAHELQLLKRRIELARIDVRRKEEAAAAWQGYRKFEVQRRVEEGGGICSFYLTPHDRKPLPAYRPGQYLTFSLRLPSREKPLVRCYSLSDAPRTEGDYYRVSIKRVHPPRDEPDAPPGLSSNHFHDHINEGDILDVKAPAGQFFLDMAKDSAVVLIGGGVGITPVLSMLNAIVDSGVRRETWLFYGVSNGAEHIQRQHLNHLESMHDNVHIRVCYSHPSDRDVAGRDYHHAERVSVGLFRRLLPSNNYDYYMCGPPSMMKSLTGDLAEWGVPKGRLHLETFTPAGVKTMTPPAVAKNIDERAAAVTFTRSGKTVSWNPDSGTVLQFAEANGIAVDSGCRAGACGSCETAIRSGEVEYLSEPDAEPAARCCLPCVCVPKGPLELDA